jgi:hypothetical protein
MALAADTRAAAVASFDRMMPTRTLSAVLVWLRASERISMIVLDLDICNLRLALLRPDIFARRGIDVIHSQIVTPHHGSKCDGRKIGLSAIMLRTANESNNFCAQENPSHTAMATNPTRASEIRYAVMPTSHLLSSSWARLTTLDTNKMRGRSPLRSFQARTLSLQARSAWRIVAAGPLRTWSFPRRNAGTFARAG